MVRTAVIPGRLEETVRGLVDTRPSVITITTPSSAGLELEIQHGLGRVPHGYSIIKRPYGSPTDIIHGEGDTDWTSDKIYIKFNQTDLELTILVW